MTPLQSTSLARALALGAGGVDVVAGGAMVVAPAWAFALVGLASRSAAKGAGLDA
jgi:hypothetical protein